MLLRLLLAAINAGVPGAGTLIAGMILPGFLQLLLWLIAVLLLLTGLPTVIGAPFYVLAVLWSVLTVLVNRNRFEAPSIEITGQ